jgi:phage/conjugal plasmid C-4 type zinc finger TraR family protein
MDILDRAQILEEKQRELSLQNAKRSQQASLSECEDCGVSIPAARQALGGVTRCIDCQSLHEHEQSRYG